ncbi:hypothetical protein LTR56_003207 [Elasticomyces elasticus]|nr:hypothetical protein LTR22_010740 [Elasticomyces elasticus]KAK3656075.1 hypothetical protein LTR56_003207 [Elasticomyces elasticus]KAK4920861.1 hypothetical protein LTR49_011583 [Elasticomyces elasticus]KAK5759621.1 hypothetical protein LTS12_010314 [Elasticomyces elasticus]
MIKTHKPRGHFWSCPSLFQQSKEIRNLSFEDCTPPTAKVIAADSDDELQPKQRAAKRRRIEKLADEFMNGQALTLSCVRPHPSTLKVAVEGNERSRTNAKYSLPGFELPEDDAVIWADVDEAFGSPRVVKAERLVKAEQPSKKAHRKSAPTVVETITEEQVSSACKQIRRPKTLTISLNPSDEAIKQAAALRARRLEKLAAEAPILPDGTSAETISESDNAEPQSEPGHSGPRRSGRDRKPKSNEWLLRRHTTLYELSADESLDELTRSMIHTPSRASQVQTKAQLEVKSEPDPLPNSTTPDSSAGNTSTHIDGPASSTRPRKRGSLNSYVEHWELFTAPSARDTVATGSAPENDTSAAKNSYHTAPEVTEVEIGDEAAPVYEDLQEDSQTRLLRHHGIQGAPRTTWTSTNGKTPAKSPAEVSVDKPADEADHTVENALRQSVQESAQSAVKAKNTKRAKSAGHKSIDPNDTEHRRRSAPTQTQDVSEQSLPYGVINHGAMKGYTVAQTKESDGTPFMFRKRTTRSKGKANMDDTTIAAPSAKQRRPMKFLSSEDGAVKRAEAGVPSVSDEAPILDVSFGNDSFAPRLNLALADEHLNAVLPGEEKSVGKSSATKRAIRHELAEGGAEISRIEGEPASSQIEGLDEARALSFSAIMIVQAGSVVNDAEKHTGEAPAAESIQTQWPGTQQLLHQAHDDFFKSPEKKNNHTTDHAVGTPDASSAGTKSAPPTTHREPLRTLSQETVAPMPLPSTQAMQEAWSPWSTVKKQKGVPARVAVPSPTSISGRKSARLSNRSVVDAERRRSSLRFSTSTTDSPVTEIPFTVTKAASQERSKLSVSFSTLTGDSTETHLTAERTSPERRKPSSSADRTITPKSIMRSSEASHQSVDDARSLFDLEPATIVEADAHDINEVNSMGSEYSSIQCGQRPLFRDDSQVDQTVMDFVTGVLSTGDLDGL